MDGRVCAAIARESPVAIVSEKLAEYESGYDPFLELTLAIDELIKEVRPDAWRGIQSREQVVKAALFGVLKDEAEVERIFPIIKAQSEY